MSTKIKKSHSKYVKVLFIEVVPDSKKIAKNSWPTYKAVDINGNDYTKLLYSLETKGDWMTQCKLHHALKGNSVIVLIDENNTGTPTWYRRIKRKFVEDLISVAWNEVPSESKVEEDLIGSELEEDFGDAYEPDEVSVEDLEFNPELLEN